MSAWVVEREHIDVMLGFGLRRKPNSDCPLVWYVGNTRRELTHETANAVGRMLAEENVASVCARYEDDTADLYDGLLGYEYRDPGYVMTPGEVFKTVGCYEYQSCEHDGWESSEAKLFCTALREDAECELYAGPWGWDAAALKTAKLSDSAAAL